MSADDARLDDETALSDRPTSPSPAAPVRLRVVTAWALWDWGSASFNAVITTFVFTRWITSSDFVARDVVDAAEAEKLAGVAKGPAKLLLDGVLADHSAWLGWGLAIGGC